MIEMKHPRPVRRKLIAGVYHFWFGKEWHRTAILVSQLEAERSVVVDGYLTADASIKSRALFLAQWKLQGCPVRMPQVRNLFEPDIYNQRALDDQDRRREAR
jgi:hypothetical protein